MPINLTVRMQDVWQSVGLRCQSRPYTFADPEWRLSVARGPQLGVWFWWPRDHGYLQLRATWHRPGDDEGTEFGVCHRGLRQVYQQLGVPDDFAPGFLEANHFMSAVVPVDAEVRLEFRVDTDDPRFLDAAAGRPAGNVGLTEVIKTFVFDREQDEPEGEICLHLEPADPPGDYAGFLALDLGSTCSTLACLPGGARRRQDVALVDADATPGRLGRVPVDSAVRIDRVNQSLLQQDPQWRDHPRCLAWVIGRAVQAETGRGGDGVVLGAKRLLAGRDYDHDQAVLAWTAMDDEPCSTGERPPRQPVLLPNRLPAELLVCRMLERFREATWHKPVQLAITHPTTFSSRERRQLREVVVRALTRLRAEPQVPEQLDASEAQVRLVLDEASAAAFAVLHHHFIQQPPGLLRLRYLYPRGLHLLLYDCGGGTTDLALVRAQVHPKTPERVDVEVLARSGLRDFGGDDVTIAACRLLRARLAIEAARAHGQTVPGQFPEGQPEQLADYLARHAEFFNRHLPTQFDPAVMNREDCRNRDHRHVLWNWALDVKHRLEKVAPDHAEGVELFHPRYGFGDLVSEYLQRGLDRGKQQALRTALCRIRVRRAEVDALVREPVLRSIACCNHMIEEKLAGQGEMPQPAGVDRVVVAGNGSRYPLIRELLRERLNVLFYDECEQFEVADLKTVVGQGAVLALAAQMGEVDLRVDFDWRLSERLPYTVGYRRAQKATPDPLYHEHELYDELKPKKVPVVRAADERRQEWFYLERRWPGETEFKEYLGFHFPQGVQGSWVEVRYDLAAEEFCASDESGAAGVLHELGPKRIYRHPLQRPDLEPEKGDAVHGR